MSKDINLNLDFKSLLPKLKKAEQPLSRHAVFIAIIVVLLIYSFVVLKINTLSNAEPTPDAETTALAKSTVPKINQSAIQSIQSLESTNTQVRSLFEQARDNPFQE